MTFDSEHRSAVRDYLLGGPLHDDIRSQVERSLLTDDAFHEELLIVEEDLIDQYLGGKLDENDRERFEQHFLCTPERFRKVKFARAFSKYVASAPEVEGATPRGRRPWANFWFTFLSPARVAATALVIIGCSILAWVYFNSNSGVDRGLAALHAAYRDSRPAEARITGFNYAPFSVTRDGSQPRVDSISRDQAERILRDAAEENPGPSSKHALGQLYLADRKYDQAISLFEEALKANERNARLHNDLGVALFQKGTTERHDDGTGEDIESLARSVVHFNRAAELDGWLSEALFNQALAYQRMMLRGQAAESWREYLRHDSSSPWADEARRNLKLLDESSSAKPNAAKSLGQFLAARQAGDDNLAWRVVSQNYTSAGNGVTNTLLDSLLAQGSKQPPTGDEADLQALAYLAHLELEKAGDRFTSDVVTQYRRATPELRLVLAEAHKRANAGYDLFTQSKIAEAINEYTGAKLAYERAGNVPGRLFTEYRLAHCYVFLPDLPHAQLTFERLSEAAERNHYSWLRAHSLYGLAHVSADRSEYSNALDSSGRALASFERMGDINGMLRCLNQLADMHQNLNQVERSLGYLRRGVALADENPVELMQKWQVLTGLALSLSSMRLYTAALFYQKEGLNLAFEMKRPLIVSRSYGYVGSAYSALKMYDEAFSNANQAFETGRTMPEGNGNEIMANASQQLGDILRQAGQCGKALEAYDRSIQLSDELRVEYYSYLAHKGKFLCFLAGSNDRIAGDELQTVLRLFEEYRSKITTESQRNSFFDMEQNVYDLAIQYEFQRAKDPIKAFEYSEVSRARSLLDAMHRGAQVLENTYGPDVNLPTVVSPMTLAQVKKEMPVGSQIVQYAVLDERVLIWVVTQSDFHLQEVNIRSERLREKVRAFIAATSRPPASNAPSQDANASELYQILVAPVEPLLDKAKFLCVVPDKMLNYLPFGALVSPATARFVTEDYNIGVAPSSTIFANLSESAVRKAGKFEERLLSVGDPSFSRVTFKSLPDLPSAAREARSVSMFYPAHRVLLHKEARERTLKSEIKKADVAHLAMHYVVNGASEMLSGFALAAERSNPTDTRQSFDGFLQFHEIYSLKLPRTRLVVLSACQTGIEQQYSGEGAVGVTRPFLVAGVPVVVASLWPVDSDASAELMVNFHKYRTRDGLPVTEALKRAQVDMAHGPDGRYRHPYYWAPFVSVGGYSQF
jgi:CHAT domain-containing protein/Flp pilus assembly protein TadD